MKCLSMLKQLDWLGISRKSAINTISTTLNPLWRWQRKLTSAGTWESLIVFESPLGGSTSWKSCRAATLGFHIRLILTRRVHLVFYHICTYLLHEFVFGQSWRSWRLHHNPPQVDFDCKVREISWVFLSRQLWHRLVAVHSGQALVNLTNFPCEYMGFIASFSVTGFKWCWEVVFWIATARAGVFIGVSRACLISEAWTVPLHSCSRLPSFEAVPTTPTTP